MRKLIVRESGGSTKEYPLPAGKQCIGRDPESDIPLKDTQVSWHHAYIESAQDQCVLRDQGSTNGTFVDGKRIDEHGLLAGDVFKIGPYQISFEPEVKAPSAASSSERTLFAVGARHPHRIDDAKDPYATAVPQSGRSSQPGVSTSKHVDRPRGESARGWRLPILTWLPDYDSRTVKDDAIAGVTVAALMIPQGMAYALLAGLPPVMGLYAAMLPMIVYALTGTGRQTSVAPVALDSILVAIGLGVLAQSGTEAYIALAVLLAGTIGLIQIVMGISRLGFLVNFLSYPVLCGFTSAAAIIIAISQLKHILGITLPQQHQLYLVIPDIAAHAAEANPFTLAIGIASTLLLVVLKRWSPSVPGPLSVLVLFTVLVGWFHLDARGVEIVGEIPSGLPPFSVPSFVWQDIARLLPLALTMALVSFAETIAVGKSLGNKYGYDVVANQELTALGLSNISSAISSGFPVSGGFSRSAVNAKSGAKSPLAAIISAILITVMVLYLTPLVSNLPNAALAGIILVSAIGLIDFSEIRYLFRVKKTEGLLLAFTFAATLIFGITPGLLLGIVASILLFITLNTRPNAAVLGRLPNTNIFRNIDDFHEAETIPGLMILRIDASFYFANTEFLKKKLGEIYENHKGELKALILDASAVNDLDSSADTALHQISAELKKNNVEFFIAGVKGPVREVMKRSGLYDTLEGDHFFFTIDAAVKRYQRQLSSESV